MLSQLSYAPFQSGFFIHRIAVFPATCYSIPLLLSFVNTFFQFFRNFFVDLFQPFKHRAAMYHRSACPAAGVKS